jgi:serine/threonine protein kinase
MALAAAPEVPGFRALSPLGYGPASTLYSAQSDTLGRWVALTVYSTALHDERAQRRFTRAFETARRLGSHPHAVTLLGSGLTLDRRPYVASEIYDRGTLDGRITGRKPLKLEEALHLGICLAGALETAHRADVIHGGVHPARVLVGSDGESALADLGLVPLVDRGGLAALIGPMSYHAAPEVLEGEPVSPATDVYSLASTVYAGLSCRAPYRGGDDDDTVASLLLRILQHAVTPMGRQDVPPFLEQVLHQALSCEAKERPERPLLLAKAFQTCQSHLGLPETQPVVLDVAASLRLAAGNEITGQADANGYGAITPMSTNGHGAAGHGDSPPMPLQRNQPGGTGSDVGGSGGPVRRVFVPYPAEPPEQMSPVPLDEPALREVGFPEPPPLSTPPPGAPPAPPAPPVPPVAAPLSAPLAPVPDYGAAPGSAWSDVQPETEADPWADLQLDPSVLAGEPAYDAGPVTATEPYDVDDDAEPVVGGLARRARGGSRDSRDSRDNRDSDAATATGPRALPVIVLMVLVAVLIAGVTWMIVTGDDAGPEDRADATSTSQALDELGATGADVEVTAAENAAGVQLDWEEPGEGSQVVLVLSQAEPPQAMAADAGTALLVPAARLQPQTGYCFAVVSYEGIPDPTELAGLVPDEVLAPQACIRGATAASVRRE